jgi:hypothetical protein
MGRKKNNERHAKTVNNVIQAVDEPLKASGIRRALPHQYKLITPDGTSSVLGILDKTAGKVRGTPPKPVGQWVIRVDTPHRGAQFNHININPEITGIPDPHIPISQGAVTASRGVAKAAKVMQKVNKVALPIAIALDTVRLGNAIYQDVKRDDGKPKQTVKTAASVAGGWVGGAAGGLGGSNVGAWAGGAIGALFGGVGAIPGAAIGSIVGGIIGGVGGGVSASYGLEKLASTAFSSDEDSEDED